MTRKRGGRGRRTGSRGGREVIGAGRKPTSDERIALRMLIVKIDATTIEVPWQCVTDFGSEEIARVASLFPPNTPRGSRVIQTAPADRGGYARIRVPHFETRPAL